MHTRWETDTRYYEVRLLRDLFGDVVMMRSWGGRGTALGRTMNTAHASEESAQRALRIITRTRARRGYRLTVGGATVTPSP